MGHHLLMWWLAAHSKPSHYLSLWRQIANWNIRNKLQWNLNQSIIIVIQGNVFENAVCIYGAFCPDIRKLRDVAWWRHQMEACSALLAICVGTLPVTSEFPAERPVPRSFEVFLDPHLNKRLSKQSWGWWFETPSLPLWHHCNVHLKYKPGL